MIQKAGGILVRKTVAGIELLCVHRPRYDDWSFPKGHKELNETDEEAALREVREETGFVCTINRRLPDMMYTTPDDQNCRVVLFEMSIVEESPEFKDAEVDSMRWCSIAEAVQLIDYPGTQEYIKSIFAE